MTSPARWLSGIPDWHKTLLACAALVGIGIAAASAFAQARDIPGRVDALERRVARTDSSYRAEMDQLRRGVSYLVCIQREERRNRDPETCDVLVNNPAGFLFPAGVP